VKELLYAHRFTIAGARRKLREGGIEPIEPAPVPEVDPIEAAEARRYRDTLVEIRRDALALLDTLDQYAAGARVERHADAPAAR
jgi:hypothetical protein